LIYACFGLLRASTDINQTKSGFVPRHSTVSGRKMQKNRKVVGNVGNKVVKFLYVVEKPIVRFSKLGFALLQIELQWSRKY
jgi:ribosomal protein L34